MLGLEFCFADGKINSRTLLVIIFSFCRINSAEACPKLGWKKEGLSIGPVTLPDKKNLGTTETIMN